VKSKFVRGIRRKVHGPRLSVSADQELMRFGSSYGGWVFVPEESLMGSTILSCGLGEDASFDVEIARLYQANVIVVDPTPRAIQHFNEIMTRMGESSQRPYSQDGCQPIESYELEGLHTSQFKLIPEAVSDISGRAKFYLPPRATEVSHSLVNFQNNYSVDTDFIEVKTIAIQDLVEQENLHDISIAIFDIEGAEIVTLPAMLAHGIRPNQILVEYDELNLPSRQSRVKFDQIHKCLIDAGYQTTSFDGRSCVSYKLA